MAVIKDACCRRVTSERLYVISRNHRSTTISEELDIGVSTPSPVLAGVVEYLDRVLLSENADSQVGGGIRHRFLERFSFACAIKPVHHRMREGGDVGFEERMANNLWPMVRNEKRADHSEEHMADTV